MLLTQPETNNRKTSTAADTDRGGKDNEPSGRSTYLRILKSSAMVGGSSLVNIAMGVVRTKAMAVLLGPSGFGLAGLYLSIATLAQSIAGMGVNSSGVRQIAEASGTDDKQRIAITAAVLRKTSIWLGAVGGILLILFSRQVSTFTFGTDQHTRGVSILALSVLLNVIAAGQGALIQGLRRISDLTRISVWGALGGTLVTIPMIYCLHEKGVVLSMVAVSAISLLSSSWYSRRLDVPRCSVSVSETAKEASSLLRLGFAFMAGGMMTLGGAYLVRIFVARRFGLEAAALYQSAWNLGSLYVGLLLQAMAADFYPRLTASVQDDALCNRLVNEQARVSLLLAGPGLLATLTFAPLAIAVFYSAKFAAAIEILRWICLATALQVITWPMGFIILAKGKSRLFFCAELAWTIVFVLMAWLAIRTFGVVGSGIAFFGSYVFHVMLIYPIVGALTGFRWTAENKRTTAFFLSLIAGVFCACNLLPYRLSIWVGSVAVLGAGVYTLRALRQMVSFSAPFPQLQPLLLWLRLAGPTPEAK